MAASFVLTLHARLGEAGPTVPEAEFDRIVAGLFLDPDMAPMTHNQYVDAIMQAHRLFVPTPTKADHCRQLVPGLVEQATTN